MLPFFWNTTPMDAQNTPVPPEVEWNINDVSSDTRQGDWIRDDIRNIDGTVGCFVPPIFRAYSRVYHPAMVVTSTNDGDTESTLSWREAATKTGAVAHPCMEWNSIISVGNLSTEHNQRIEEPMVGELPERETGLLCDLLAKHTLTPSVCWFGFWTGRGFEGFSLSTPRLDLPGRDYFLFQGSAYSAIITLQGFGPNIWWPQDKAWFVATDIDLQSTYVGGSENCIEDILAADGLETSRASERQSVTWDSDTINLPPHRSR